MPMAAEATRPVVASALTATGERLRPGCRAIAIGSTPRSDWQSKKASANAVGRLSRSSVPRTIGQLTRCGSSAGPRLARPRQQSERLHERVERLGRDTWRMIGLAALGGPD